MKLICPICKSPLTLEAKSYKCNLNHTYDQAKSGYINLNAGKNSTKTQGDNKLMVTSRSQFLQKNYYQALLKQLNQLLIEIDPQVLLDCGCGEGYYTSHFANQLNQCEIYGFDLSKEAIHHASKQDKKTQYVISSIFHIPMANECADTLINIFAPIALDEFYRLMKKDAVLIVVGPSTHHLFDLKKAIYDHPYENQVEYINDPRFQLYQEVIVNDHIHLASQEDIQALFTMTPYFYKTSIEDKAKLETLETLDTQISFSIQIYHLKNE